MKTNPHDLVSAYGYANEQSHFDSNGGLTKREHFAAMALQGLLANSNSQGGVDDYARGAVNFADALIEELNKPKP